MSFGHPEHPGSLKWVLIRIVDDIRDAVKQEDLAKIRNLIHLLISSSSPWIAEDDDLDLHLDEDDDEAEFEALMDLYARALRILARRNVVSHSEPEASDATELAVVD